MVREKLRFKASDGKEIVYVRVLPEGRAAAVLVIGHGMAEHGNRYLHLAEALLPLGIASWIPDLRGHGETDPGPDRGHLGNSGDTDRIVLDLVELGRRAVEEAGGVPLYYFGHSYGAYIGKALAGSYGKELSGCVLSSPPAKPDPLLDFAAGIIIGLAILFKGPKAPGLLPKKLTFGAYAKTVPDAHTEFDWLSRDHGTVSAYMSDPDCGFTCSYGFYRDLAAGVRRVCSREFMAGLRKDLPLYIFAGSADPVIGMREGLERMASRFRDSGFQEFETRCYEGGRHESINETNRAEVLSDLREWFRKRLGRR